MDRDTINWIRTKYTMLLGTVVAAKDAKPDTDFMPLQVEVERLDDEMCIRDSGKGDAS